MVLGLARKTIQPVFKQILRIHYTSCSYHLYIFQDKKTISYLSAQQAQAPGLVEDGVYVIGDFP